MISKADQDRCTQFDKAKSKSAKITYRDVLVPRGVPRPSSWHSKISYARDFPLPSSKLKVCEKLPAGFDPSTPRNSKTTYRDVLLSLKENRKDRPRGVEFSSVRRSKFSYTRDFLLSLSELEVCKRLPGGFDPLTLCEVDASCSSLFDVHKISGSLHESGVSRCVSSSSRGSAGKRDSHSLGQNNQHRGSQCERDSGDESHYGPHSQSFGQFAEHNGLFGSGLTLFQCTAGTSAPKPEAQLQYELRKSDNPYRHPYSYEELSEGGRASDLHSKEADSSAESLNKERVEDEKTKEGQVSYSVLLDGMQLSIGFQLIKSL